MRQNKWPLKPGIKGDAKFDEKRSYRYWLRREWDISKNMVTYIMLNPSEADDKWDDRAVLRCINFAQQWGFGSLEIVNLFAFRSPKPDILKQAVDPIGPDNDYHIIKAVQRTNKIISAWGNDGAYKKRNSEVLYLLRDYDLYCMGQTADKHPKYPARLPSNTSYMKYRDGLWLKERTIFSH